MRFFSIQVVNLFCIPFIYIYLWVYKKKDLCARVGYQVHLDRDGKSRRRRSKRVPMSTWYGYQILKYAFAVGAAGFSQLSSPPIKTPNLWLEKKNMKDLFLLLSPLASLLSGFWFFWGAYKRSSFHWPRYLNIHVQYYHADFIRAKISELFFFCRRGKKTSLFQITAPIAAKSFTTFCTYGSVRSRTYPTFMYIAF